MRERRYWSRSDSGTSVVMVVFPGQEWYNGSGPGGFWEKSGLGLVMSPVPQVEARSSTTLSVCAGCAWSFNQATACPGGEFLPVAAAQRM